MLGFDAVGRQALGQIPASPNIVFAALGASYVVTANPALFSTEQLSATTSYTLTGKASFFKPAIAASAGTYAETGVAALFSMGMLSPNASYVLTGNSAFLSVGNLTASKGLFAVTGNPANLNLSLASVAVASTTGSYSVTGIDVSFTRDFEDWIPRPFESDAWTSGTKQAETWTPATKQSETWTVS
jgi:hypothetical protein